MIRTFLILALIAVAAVILFTRNQQASQGPNAAGTAEQPQPGYFMTDARIVQTGPDGLPLYRITADRIQQDPANFTIRMRHLELDYRATAPDTALGRTWTLTARQGDMPQVPARTGLSGDTPQTPARIELSGNVEIVGEPLPGTDGPVARIRTQKLSIDTQSEIARTDQPVEMFLGDSSVSATGLKVDMKAERIQLESKVHGRILR